MSLQKRINDELIASMKNKEQIKLDTLRMIKSALGYALIEKKKEDLSDEDVIGVLQKQIKQRQESYENFKKGGREELASKEKKEIEIIEAYLPKQLSDEELKALVAQAIQESGAKTKADTGKVMKVLVPKLAGRADGKRTNAVVMSLLA